jgi:hypothetical protein
MRGEHERAVGEFDTLQLSAGLGPAPVFDTHFDGGLVDRHPVRAMGLGGPQHRTGRSVQVGAVAAKNLREDRIIDEVLATAATYAASANSSTSASKPQSDTHASSTRPTPPTRRRPHIA